MKKVLRSYSSPLNYGHKHLEDLFDDEAIVQEKIDGSQFSFGVVDGELHCRSRNAKIDMDAPNMFDKAVSTAQTLYNDGLLEEGYTYRGEYLMKPKHNTLKYERVPDGYVILFDIDRDYEDYMSPAEAETEAKRLGLEYVPTWTVDEKPPIDTLREWVEVESILGGSREGIVIKNYNRIGPDKKTLMGKYVRQEFKEKHEKDWKNRNPGKGDILLQLEEKYRTEARWKKAIQHRKEAGELQVAPQDIGPLIREISQDIRNECEQEIKEVLFNHYWKDLSRRLTAGFPEWYKEKLAEGEIG